MVFSKRSEVCDVGLTRKNDTVDQRLNKLQNRRLHEIEILNVDLSRVQARPGACDTATVSPGDLLSCATSELRQIQPRLATGPAY